MSELTSPDHIVQIVRDLAAQDYTAAEIGKKIGKTRSAVLGICHRKGIRLGLTRPPKLPCVEATDIAPAQEQPRVHSVFGLERHHCRWPIGDPKQPGFGFCGRTAMTDEKGNYKPYCAEHAAVAYADK